MRLPTVVFISLAVLGLCGPAFGRTWYIKADGTGDAPTIQAGVDAASAGDIVLVASGTYTASTMVIVAGTPAAVCVAIDKEITLISESGPAVTTIGDASKNIGIYVHSVGGSAKVSGLRVTTSFGGFSCVGPALTKGIHEAPPANATRGIRCENASPTIEANILDGNTVGIELIGSSAHVTNNTVNSSGIGIGAYNSDAEIAGNVIHASGVMIECEGGSPNIHDNEIYDGCTGIGSGPGTSPIVSTNFIHDLQVYGIDCVGSSISIEGNRIQHTYGAIRMGSAAGTFVHGNILTANAVGIDVSEGSSGTIESNTIDGAIHGIVCEILSTPTIRRSIIVGSDVGIQCVNPSSPVLECNDVFTSVRYAGACGDQTGINGNISADPQFCGPPGSGNYAIQSDSPCAPDHHPNGADCGTIGALGVGCGGPLKTEAKSWGAIKALYR